MWLLLAKNSQKRVNIDCAIVLNQKKNNREKKKGGEKKK